MTIYWKFYQNLSSRPAIIYLFATLIKLTKLSNSQKLKRESLFKVIVDERLIYSDQFAFKKQEQVLIPKVNETMFEVLLKIFATTSSELLQQNAKYFLEAILSFVDNDIISKILAILKNVITGYYDLIKNANE